MLFARSRIRINPACARPLSTLSTLGTKLATAFPWRMITISSPASTRSKSIPNFFLASTAEIFAIEPKLAQSPTEYIRRCGLEFPSAYFATLVEESMITDYRGTSLSSISITALGSRVSRSGSAAQRRPMARSSYDKPFVLRAFSRSNSPRNASVTDSVMGSPIKSVKSRANRSASQLPGFSGMLLPSSLLNAGSREQRYPGALKFSMA